MPLEIAAFNANSAILAYEAGASRLELCGGPKSTGGVTPSLASVIQVKKVIRDDVAVHVMIRPSPPPPPPPSPPSNLPSSEPLPVSSLQDKEISDSIAQFTCTNQQVEEIKAQIQALAPYADGFVFGVLDQQTRRVDKEVCTALVELAEMKGRGKRSCTFHRAIDYSLFPLADLAVIKECGFTSVLTSGGKGDAMENVEGVKEMLKHGKEVGLEVIVGGGVRKANVGELVEKTGCQWVHSACIVGDREVVCPEEVEGISEVLAGSERQEKK